MPDELHTTLSLDRYLPPAKALVARAQALADERRHVEVQPLHLLSRALERGRSTRAVFERATSSVLDFEAAVERALSLLPQAKEPSYLSDAMIDLLGRAERDATQERAPRVTAAHLLNALSQEIRGAAGEILAAFGVVPGSLRRHVALLDEKADAAAGEVTAGPAPELTRPLLDGPQASDPVIARAGEVRRLVTILERRQKNHPLLVGEAGVGKRAIVRALARRIAAGDVPSRLAGVKLVELDLGALTAGARLRTELDDRLRRLFATLSARGGVEHILFVPGLEQLLGQGSASQSLLDALRLALSRSELRVLSTTTPDGLRKLLDKEPILARSFTEIEVEEPSLSEAIEIVRGMAQSIEQHHGVPIQDRALVAAVELAKRYVQERRLPDAAIDLLDEAAAAKRVEIDGVPLELDRLLPRLDSLKAQLAALADEDDASSKELAQKLESEQAQLAPRVAALRTAMEGRRGVTATLKALRGELAAAEAERERLRQEKNNARFGELEHVLVPDLKARLAKAEEAARAQGEGPSPKLLEQDVAATLAAWTGIPVDKMLEAEAEKLLKMEGRLGERIVGQDHALAAVARAVRRGRVGLRDPKRPIGSFLLLGPSGVGKTELAKALAEFLFDDEASLTRLDMSEFMERHMAQRLIGAPPGYADSDQGGFLTEAVRRRPYSVLLFDEVEKAHQDVFNLLLQVLDDGRLTDGRGRLADFSNTVVVMTSNIGSERILEAEPKLFESEDGRQAMRDLLFDRLGSFFRPEFLNRLDDVVVFRPLSKTDLRRIVDIRLKEVGRMLASRRLLLEVSEAAKQRLVELGYQPALGARPLKRTLLKELQDPLAQALLAAPPSAAGGTVKVDMTGEGLAVVVVPNS
ncbi:MAG TPA: AAA family ATPase [Polyangiaceae bacterium]|nr:AAA family ATPase [Polyangiaceae bacterium]